MLSRGNARLCLKMSSKARLCFKIRTDKIRTERLCLPQMPYSGLVSAAGTEV